MATQIYAIEKETNLLRFKSDSIATIINAIKEFGKTENDFYILEDFNMKYVSRITYVDGQCIYNNKDFWCTDLTEFLENYNKHDVKDFLGQDVGRLRFESEMLSNRNRLYNIDGIAGEVEYNIIIGNEFIALFREECVKTDFVTISPLEIAQKLSSVIGLVQTGSFREAKVILQSIETDEFLTEERLQKYIDMMDAADAIDYATEEEFFYKADDEKNEDIKETDVDEVTLEQQDE